MGNNTLSTVVGGIGQPTQVNQYKEALSGDILPRNVDGEVEALAANLGSSAAPFSGASIRGPVDILGVDKAQTVTSSQTFSFPSGAYEKKCIVFSNAGLGSAGGVSGNSTSGSCWGGGGGGGASVVAIDLSWQESITVTINAVSTTISSADIAGVVASHGSNGLETGGGGIGGTVTILPTDISRVSFFANGGDGGNGGGGFWASSGTPVAANGQAGYRGDLNIGGYAGTGAAGGVGQLTGGGGGGASLAAKVAGYAGGNGGSLSGASGGVVFTWKERA